MSDPWASPGHTSRKSAQRPQPPSGQQQSTPQRTTSAFTTATENTSSATPSKPPPPSEDPSGGGAEDWGGGGGFGPADNLGASRGFSGDGDDNDHPRNSGPQAATRRQQVSHGAQEVLSVTTLPEKEGPFLFQYRNYEIASSRRSVKVIRRYSDFVWLLDCLHKRYPFRLLPLLPPKSLSGESLTFLLAGS